MRINHNINIRFSFLIISIYLLIFQNLLQSFIPLFQYFDELLSIFAIPVFIVNLIKTNKQKNKNKLMILMLIIVLVIGLIAILLYKKQSIQYALYDVLVFYKFYLVLFMSEILFDTEFINKYRNKWLFHNNIIIIIFLVLTIANLFMQIWPSEIRFGIMTNRLFYSHPTFLVSICIFLLCVSLRLNKKIVSWQTFIMVIILISTLRIKAIGAVIAILLISYYIEKSSKIISISKIMIVGAILFVFAFDQINFYFFQNDGFARKELLNSGIEIAKDYFPIGTGFGTYGSYYSGVNYSPVYYEYGLNKVYGLQPFNYSFIADSFYPMILGQFGYLGLTCYIICLYLLFKKMQKIDISTNKYAYISKIASFIFLIICSTSESAFAGPMSIIHSILIGINDDNEKEEKYG